MSDADRRSEKQVPFLGGPAFGYVLLAAFALYFLIGGRNLPFGDLAQIGPGFFPTVFAVILLAMSLVGVALEWRKATSAGSASPIRLDWRPLIFVSLAILVFALLVRRVGLVPASVASAFVASLSRSPVHPRVIAAIAVGVGVLVWAIFIAGLNLSIAPYRMPF